MLRTLYDIFQHWSESGSVYVYSDTHFEDDDCKLMDPNWVTPQEQIDIINKLVHKNDTLILLGDVGNVEWVKKLKAGYKVLITGNHDSGAENYKRHVRVVGIHRDTGEEIELENMDNYIFRSSMWSFWKHHENDGDFMYCKDIKIIDNRLFDEVYTGPLMISDKIILSHEPIPNINWALNICGHDHSASCNDKYHYCVCSNTINYTPVNLKDIINSGCLKDMDSLHRIIINNATEKSIHKANDWAWKNCKYYDDCNARCLECMKYKNQKSDIAELHD